jgi:hypothetical protein
MIGRLGKALAKHAKTRYGHGCHQLFLDLSTVVGGRKHSRGSPHSLRDATPRVLLGERRIKKLGLRYIARKKMKGNFKVAISDEIGYHHKQPIGCL